MLTTTSPLSSIRVFYLCSMAPLFYSYCWVTNTSLNFILRIYSNVLGYVIQVVSFPYPMYPWIILSQLILHQSLLWIFIRSRKIGQIVYQLGYPLTNALLFLVFLLFNQKASIILQCGSITIVLLSLLCWKFHIFHLLYWRIALLYQDFSAMYWSNCINTIFKDYPESNITVNVALLSPSDPYEIGNRRYGRFWYKLNIYCILCCPEIIFMYDLFWCTFLVS